MKPVTVRASTYGDDVTELQQQGIDHIVEYLANALTPGPLLPFTGRIVIEWGNEFVLDEIRKDAE